MSTVIRNNGCLECLGAGKTSSKGEKELYDYIVSIINGDVLRGGRSVIAPKELDIYIPEKKIAIEFNGVYWHTLDKVNGDKNYHYDKWKMCADKGIQLITIWEDEWRDKQEIVKSMLAYKLGVNDGEKVYARNTQVVNVTTQVARDFLNDYHIQGFASGSVYYALVDKDDLSKVYAVSVWRKTGNVLYLDRYATSCNVVGGLGKLLKYGELWAKDNDCDSIQNLY